MIQPRYIVVKSVRRNYGYALQDTDPSKGCYFTGPKQTAGWYRRKRDAQHQADILNSMTRGDE